MEQVRLQRIMLRFAELIREIDNATARAAESRYPEVTRQWSNLVATYNTALDSLKIDLACAMHEYATR